MESVSVINILVIITTIMGITGAGSLAGLVIAIRNWGKQDEGRRRDITSIKNDICSIQKTLGNGGYSGLRQAIHDMQINCAGKMANVEARMKNLENQRNSNQGG